jgi:hypothetical protein
MTGAMISQQGKPGRFLLANYPTHNRVGGVSADFALDVRRGETFRSHIKVMERLKSWNDCHEQVFRLGAGGVRYRNEFQAKPQE